jgi:hypothetical protein
MKNIKAILSILLLISIVSVKTKNTIVKRTISKIVDKMEKQISYQIMLGLGLLKPLFIKQPILHTIL